MKKPNFWITLVVASTVLALYVTWREGALRGDLLVEVLPLILGKVVALVFIPVVVVGIVFLFGKLIKRHASNTTIFGVTAVVWIFLAVSSITATSYETSDRNVSYVFQPKGCKYTVRFPDVPNFYSIDIENTIDKLVPIKGAQLTIGNGNAFLRAECGSHPKSVGVRPTKEQMYTYMKIISSRLGLQLPVYEYNADNSETVGTVTGTKNSERGSLTFRVINYIGGTSNMTLYVGSRSIDFMTPDMRRFLSSIKKKPSTQQIPTHRGK